MEFKLSPVTALIIDAEKAELVARYPATLDFLDDDAGIALAITLILEDCMSMWDDRQAFQVRVAAWRSLAREFAAVAQ